MLVIYYCEKCDRVKFDKAKLTQKKCSVCKQQLYRVVISEVAV